MRIAIVWAGDARLVAMTVRLDLYSMGLSALGHDVCVYCKSGCETGYAGTVGTFADHSELLRPHFWKSLRADLALMITWSRMVDYLQTARAAGQKIIAITDMDGQASARLFFKSRLIRAWLEGDRRLYQRGKLAWYFLKLYFGTWRKEDTTFIRSTELTERSIFASEGARRTFSRCLALHDREDLINKLRVVPFPVNPAFLSPEPQKRLRRAVAIGRWNSPQKNAPLLARAAKQYYDRGGDWEIVVVGAGGTASFGHIAERISHFSYVEQLSAREIAHLLNSSQVLLCTSWWEGCPVVAFEALASGCTLVTTPLPSVRSLINSGSSGTDSDSFGISSFLGAMQKEFSAWDQGSRLTASTAADWRQRLQLTRICEELLDEQCVPPR